MNITRRSFTKYSILTLTLGSSISLSGCNVFTDIENWIPVGEAAFQGIVTLLEGAGLINPTISTLVADTLQAFNDLLTAVKQYEAVNPPPVGALNKIQTMFNLIVSNFQSLLSQISASPIIQVVIGLAQIIMSTIAGFINELPSNPTIALTGVFKIANQMVSYTPKVRTVGRFKKDYNSVAKVNGHPEIELKLTLLERL